MPRKAIAVPLVFNVICESMSERSPSFREIADSTFLSEKSVQRAVKFLRSAGAITIENWRRGQRYQYRINPNTSLLMERSQ